MKKTAVPTLQLPDFGNKRKSEGNLREQRLIKKQRKEMIENILCENFQDISSETLAFQDLPEDSLSLAPVDASKDNYNDMLQKYNDLNEQFTQFKHKQSRTIRALNEQVRYYKNKKSPGLTKKTSMAANLLEKILTPNQIALLQNKKKTCQLDSGRNSHSIYSSLL